MKKVLVLVCCMAILLSTCVGCGVLKSFIGGENESETATDVVDTGTSEDDTKGDSSEEDTEEETDEHGFVVDDIDKDVRFEGQDIVIMAWSDTHAEYDFKNSATSKEIIAKSTHQRNVAVQTRLNVKLKFNLDYDGDNDNRADYIAKVEQNLASGIKYDIIACYSQCSANFAMSGLLLDLKEYDDIINLEKPWWSPDMIESSVINDKLYFTSGSIATSNLLQTFVIAVNMDKIATMGLDDPRELVKKGDWTLEEFTTMCKDTYANLNEDDPNKDVGDEFGFTSMDSVVGDGFYTGVGYKYIVPDASGKLVLSDDFTGNNADTLASQLMSLFNTKDYYYNAGFTTFMESRTLFYATHFWQLLKGVADLGNISYGYVPFPKADEYQERYYSTSGFPYSMWSITIACDNEAAERAAYTMEAVGSESYRKVQPQVHNSIKTKVGDDVINKDMFDIIIESKVYDMGRIYHNVFDWTDAPVMLFRQRLYNEYGEGQGWSSIIADHIGQINTGLDSINSEFGY